MRAWVLQDYGTLSREEIAEPSGEGALVHVEACGICGSDLSVYKGTPAMRARWRPPLILGHEIAGIVEDGPANWIGRLVAVNPVIPCGKCPICRLGRTNLCPHRQHVGFHLPGGLAEKIRVPLDQLYPLPSELPPWKAALAEPLAVVLRALRSLGTILGDRVLVLGGGGLGSLAAWALVQSGAEVLIVEPHPERRNWLRNLGFESSAEPKGDTFSKILDTVGSATSLAQAVSASALSGRIVLVGLAQIEAQLPLQPIVLGERELIGSYIFTHEDFARATNLLPRLPTGLVQTQPFEEAPRIFKDLLCGQIFAPKVVLVRR